MGRLRMATPSNRTAGEQIAVQLRKRAVSTARRGQLALKLAPGEPEHTVEKLAEFVAAEAELDRLTYALAGAAILGGLTAAQVSEATGIPLAQLTRRVPRQITALRGRQLAADSGAPYGWSNSDHP